MSKADSKAIAEAALRYIGVPYSKYDCQALVEVAMKDCGVDVNLAGSNAWFRKCTWTGTPEECLKKFGTIPVGAFLFILKKDGKEPEKYRKDGLGNASHIGLKTAKTGQNQGAVHSSLSKGYVCESTFRNRSISGGWNRVGIWIERISYGAPFDPVVSPAKPDPKPVDGGDEQELPVQTVTVLAENGYPVKLRKTFNEKSKSYRIWVKIPVGTVGVCLQRGPKWCYCQFGSKLGWMKTEFLAFG